MQLNLNLNLKKKREMSKKLRFFHFCHGLKMAFKNRLKLLDCMSVYKSIIQRHFKKLFDRYCQVDN
jgi:hypothetical protein